MRPFIDQIFILENGPDLKMQMAFILVNDVLD